MIGAFYLTDKLDGSGFTQADRHLIEILGAHAAVAIGGRHRASFGQKTAELVAELRVLDPHARESRFDVW